MEVAKATVISVLTPYSLKVTLCTTMFNIQNLGHSKCTLPS